MSERRETEHPNCRMEWRSIDLHGAHLDIRARGVDVLHEMMDLWSAICAVTKKSKNKKKNAVPEDLAEHLAELLSDQVADYIATFPEGTHVAVARHIIHGIFWDWMYPDTDAFNA